jgi:putative nucleotidyltransferase with HDIG domain
MSVHAIREAERTRASRAQRGQPMSGRVLRREALVAACFLAGAAALAALGGARGFSPATAALFVLGIAIAGNVRFDVGAGFTVPVQAVFVPMLFAVPVAVVPALVALALALGMLPSVLRGAQSPDWLLTALSNSWFALGPAFVLLVFADHSPNHDWWVLVLALAAQFACDFAACSTRERLAARCTVRELLSEVKPIYAIDVALSTLGLAVAIAASAHHGYWTVLLIVPLFGVLQAFSRERQVRLEQLVELQDAYQGTALLLGDVVEADDGYTGEHSRSVVRLALDVAEELGLDADRKRSVQFSALLHDVGKIAVPKEIVNKPGPLDAEEWAVMKTHTIEGQRMLERIGGVMREVGRIVRASHERWDGDGYPDNLGGEEIPLEARIVSVCDAFSAMTTDRSALSVSLAVAELQRCAGSQFDPAVVGALVSALSAKDALGAEDVGSRELAAGALVSRPAVLVGSCGAAPAPALRPSAG